MKKMLSILCVCATLHTYAQPKIVTQAIITTKTTVVVPEGEEERIRRSLPALPEGAEVRIMNFAGGGETISITTVKGDLVKIFTETEMSRSTVLRDNAKKTTTTITEAMGTKSGLLQTDDDREAMRKRMDSIVQNRVQQAGLGVSNTGLTVTNTDFVYMDETKKIAGLQCKKVLFVNTRQNGKKDSIAVWYSPDFMIEGLPKLNGSASGRVSFSGRSPISLPFEKLAGFPMQYEIKTASGRSTTVEVTKVVLDKEIADKEFMVPKDVTVRNMKDMQMEGGGDGRIRTIISGQPQ
jgi:hypothetical protein